MQKIAMLYMLFLGTWPKVYKFLEMLSNSSGILQVALVDMFVSQHICRIQSDNCSKYLASAAT